MSDFTVVVVQQEVNVDATKEQNSVQVEPVQGSEVQVSPSIHEISVEEKPVEIEILKSPDVTVEIQETPSGCGCDIENIDIHSLSVTKIYAENISALQLVTASSSTEVKIAEPAVFNTAKVLGVAFQGGITGFDGRIILSGVLEDPIFNYPVNDLLYLGTNGTITNTPPVVGFSVTVGYSLGNGSIFIKIEEPIELV